MNLAKIGPLLAVCALAAASPVRAGSITAFYDVLGGTHPLDSSTFLWLGNPLTVNTGEGLGTRTDLPAGPGVDNQVPLHFQTFCVEIGQNLYVPTNNFHANVVPLFGANTQLTGDPSNNPVIFDGTRTLMEGRLWGGFHSLVVDHFTAAAFQLAVWELAFDNDQSLLGGSFQGLPADLANNSSVAHLAETWLAQVGNGNIVLPVQQLLLLTDPSVQDLITPMPETPHIPEPSTLALLGLGSAVIGGHRLRRARRRATA